MDKTMEKFCDNSSSFKIWESPEDIDRNRFEFGRRNDSDIDKRKNCLNDNCRENFGEKKIHKMTKCGASTSKDLSSTKTPENTKIPETPKAPIKLRSKKLKKIDAIPKKLQFLEAENENGESIDSGFATDYDNHRYPTRSNLKSQSQRENAIKAETKNFNDKPKNKSKKNFDKENNFDLAKKSTSNRKCLSKLSNNLTKSKNLETPEDSIEREPLKRQRSMCDSNDWKEHLRWLQPRRDIGVWIECCKENCKKWRYVENYHDPVDVPKIWYCEMNLDKKFANCEIPQQIIPSKVEEELIMNAYNAGSIVWARLNGFPWWPAMIDDCPDFLRYYETHENSKIPHKYHVIFFNKKVEIAWLPVKDIKPYANNPPNTFLKKTKFRRKDFTNELKIYCEIATKALSLTIIERLKSFSYVSRISIDDTEKIAKKKLKLQEIQTIRIKSRIINADAFINENHQNFQKSSKNFHEEEKNHQNFQKSSKNFHEEEKNYQNFQKSSKNVSKIVEKKNPSIETLSIDSNEIFLSQNENFHDEEKNHQNFQKSSKKLSKIVEKKNPQIETLSIDSNEILLSQNENFHDEEKNHQNFQKSSKNFHEEKNHQNFSKSSKNFHEEEKNHENFQKSSKNFRKEEKNHENFQKSSKNFHEEEKNHKNFSKSSKNLSKSKNNETMTIDDTEEEIIFDDYEISRGKINERKNRKSNDDNYSYVDEFSNYENVSKTMMNIFARWDAKDKIDDREKSSRNNNVEISMEIDNDQSNSFTAEEFMPRPSKNMILDEFSSFDSNESNFDIKKEKSFTSENGESNFFNDNHSSIGFSADEFEPRSRKINNSSLNYHF